MTDDLVKRAKQDAIYADEPWANLAVEAGFRPWDTESSARSAFRFCADRIEALTAELAAERKARDEAVGAAVRVKPLEWHKREPHFHASESIVGMYYISEYPGRGVPFSLEVADCVGRQQWFATIEAAQAAAQSDYERRILAAIEPDPAAITAHRDAITPAEAARVLLAHTENASGTDAMIQAAMDRAMETDGTREQVFVFRAALRALAGDQP